MAVYWMAFGGFVLWLVPRVATATVAFRAMLGIMAFSGAARLLSTVLVGRPHPVLFAATFVELCVPVLLWLWQGRIAATAATA